MANESIRVTVLMGGPDGEREISLQSGSQVAAALEGHDGIQVRPRIIDRPDRAQLEAMLQEDDAHVVFPVLHGPWGEGGPLQRLLEEIGIPFVGSPHLASQRAMDKLVAKTIAAECGIPTPIAHEIGPLDRVDVPLPVVIKPADDGSSLGVRLCRKPEEITDALFQLRPAHSRLMCESFVQGRELTVGILGNEALPIIEIRPTDGFYDYEAKYLRDDTEFVVNPEISPELAAQIQDWSRSIIQAMGVEDLARVDWLLEGDNPWFLEVNTIPGMTPHSLLPMAAAASGRDMTTICSQAVLGVLQRTAEAN